MLIKRNVYYSAYDESGEERFFSAWGKILNSGTAKTLLSKGEGVVQGLSKTASGVAKDFKPVGKELGKVGNKYANALSKKIGEVGKTANSNLSRAGITIDGNKLRSAAREGISNIGRAAEGGVSRLGGLANKFLK